MKKNWIITLIVAAVNCVTLYNIAKIVTNTKEKNGYEIGYTSTIPSNESKDVIYNGGGILSSKHSSYYEPAKKNYSSGNKPVAVSSNRRKYDASPLIAAPAFNKMTTLDDYAAKISYVRNGSLAENSGNYMVLSSLTGEKPLANITPVGSAYASNISGVGSNGGVMQRTTGTGGDDGFGGDGGTDNPGDYNDAPVGNGFILLMVFALFYAIARFVYKRRMNLLHHS